MSGYYTWRHREPSQHRREDALLDQKVQAAFHNNREVYRRPRIHAELHAQGYHCARKRVACLMQEQNLFAKHPRHRTRTTQSKEGAPVAPNLLQQDFHADKPNQKWTCDTTYIWTQEGWLYLVVALDVFSRMVVGWSLSNTHDVNLVLQAVRMALARRHPPKALLHHSDRGSVSTSERYLAVLHEYDLIVSMSRTANCYDNAVTESFFHRLKGECVERSSFQTRTQARSCLFEYIKTFYNRIRRHSTLHYLNPLLYEQLI